MWSLIDLLPTETSIFILNKVIGDDFSYFLDLKSNQNYYKTHLCSILSQLELISKSRTRKTTSLKNALTKHRKIMGLTFIWSEKKMSR